VPKATCYVILLLPGGLRNPASAYLNKFYYDCLTNSEAALRTLIDTVGVDKAV
jgi:hypothetical protein